ncbi:hypothetical protein LIER_40470 [Lithospermum erythrorhizon]|uniref:Uncharacterized protein n=1 Tax=Lithospermum erythrorhizon TaxID=34254 RepID=A0AAV3QVA9_LITER
MVRRWRAELPADKAKEAEAAWKKGKGISPCKEIKKEKPPDIKGIRQIPGARVGKPRRRPKGRGTALLPCVPPPRSRMGRRASYAALSGEGLGG